MEFVWSQFLELRGKNYTTAVLIESYMRQHIFNPQSPKIGLKPTYPKVVPG